MRHNLHHRQFLFQHQRRRTLLDVHGRAVAAQYLFFVYPYSRGGNSIFVTGSFRGKQKHPATGPRRRQSICDHGRMRYSHQDRAAPRPSVRACNASTSLSFMGSKDSTAPNLKLFSRRVAMGSLVYMRAPSDGSAHASGQSATQGLKLSGRNLMVPWWTSKTSAGSER